jgi:signal transduction histidine kinase
MPGEDSEPLALESLPRGKPAGPIRRDCRECLGAVAHRLSQPLTALRGSMELALWVERSAAEYHAALEQSLDLTDHLVRWIAGLRDLAESAAPCPALERVALGELVGTAVEELRPLAESRGLVLTFGRSGKAYVRAHPERLREALLRILHHALKSSPEGGAVRITVSVFEGMASLAIFDERPVARPGESDPWREASTLGRAFSEAAKADNLDAAIAQCLVEAMGGTIQVECGVAQGCCLQFRLPLAGGKDI